MKTDTAARAAAQEPPIPFIIRHLYGLAIALVAIMVGFGALAEDTADDDDDGALAREFRYGTICTATARAAQRACRNEGREVFWTAIGNCANVSDPIAASECSDDAKADRRAEMALCGDRFDARRDLCFALGKDAYEPTFDPADFVDPMEIGVTVAANPYFPLEQGRRWVYAGDGETIVVTVRDETKLIGGVTCLVVNDRVEEDGAVVEDTEDWYAQDVLGNVWYCGEIARNYERVEGEAAAELVDVDGSWKAFRDYARPGIVMQAVPRMSDVYRQEFALREAEDAAQIVMLDGTATVAAASCHGTCLITREFTPVQPDVEEYKYYAPGIGLILEVDPEGNRVELVEFTR
ncbi:MAG: hypothetical protein HKM95_03710 [Inquilinus sp.]|nr:hypothetical protein [Inquilinus sp.]